MARYKYKAKEGPDKIVEGELTADSEKSALAAIESLGYAPVHLMKLESDDGRIIKKRGGKVRHSDVTLFTFQLATLLKSGVPILKALRTVGDQTESANLAVIIKNIEHDVRDGNMLSEAMAEYHDVFPEIYISMLHTGEAGGVIDEVLFRLASAREKDEDLRDMIQAALAYPLLILSAGIITVFVLFSFFLPRITSLFNNFNDLPLITRMLLSIANFFSQAWYWIILVVVLIALIFKRLITHEKGKHAFELFKLHMPILGKFVWYSEIVRFVRTLALLFESGVPIENALRLAGDVLGTSTLKTEIQRISVNTVKEGRPLSYGLKNSEFFPPLVANMVAVGEESGHLERLLMEIAEYYEKRLEQQTRIASSLLEPLLILIVGAVVGFIVAAMLLPLFKLSTLL